MGVRRACGNVRAAMRLLRLNLKNVGPFEDATLEFGGEDPDAKPGVTFLTGINGSGKSVVLDAIRYWFGGLYGRVERDLARTGHEADFRITPALKADGRTHTTVVASRTHLRDTHAYNGSEGGHPVWSRPITAVAADASGTKSAWVVDYWCPAMAAGEPAIQSFASPSHHNALQDSLSGVVQRAKVTELLCYFDYLRDSRIEDERAIGESLHAVTERIVEESLLEGRYVGVRRTNLTPFVEQVGHTVPLANISSGNAYMIQRMVGLLGRMHSLQLLAGLAPADICNIPGLLLIDEAEAHLHPRWQKTFLPSVQKIFPNLQLVVTTHSPFILASVRDAQVYVCRYDDARRVCAVSEETAAYQNKPVDEILMSPAFDETPPFGAEISKLLAARDRAIVRGDVTKRKETEAKLIRRNPTYFSYLRVDEELDKLAHLVHLTPGTAK